MSNQDYDGYMPPDIAARLREIGTEIDPPATAAVYAPLLAAASKVAVAPVRDIAYGRHERNVLDVFSTAAQGADLPVVVFVHGGGFVRGAKSTQGSPFYDNVMQWVVRAGYVGVNINYRLSPESVWPAGIEDLSQVVAWIRDNIEDHGGDVDKVFLWGHSAGAAHVADYLAERAIAGRDDGIRGAVLLSGFYDLGTEISNWSVYYGEDVSQYPARSSLPGLLRTPTALMIVDAELDLPQSNQQAEQLAAALAGAGRDATRLHLANHSHLSEGYAVGTSDRSLTDPLARFIATTLDSE